MAKGQGGQQGDYKVKMTITGNQKAPDASSVLKGGQGAGAAGKQGAGAQKAGKQRPAG